MTNSAATAPKIPKTNFQNSQQASADGAATEMPELTSGMPARGGKAGTLEFQRRAFAGECRQRAGVHPFSEIAMYAPDDTEWPVWALPYINVARVAAAFEPAGQPGRVRQPSQSAQGSLDPVHAVVAQFVRAAQVKDLARKLPERKQKEMTQSAESTIAMLLDEYCGTPPRRWPWPFPGPSPWSLQMATELSFIANTLQAGGLRDEITGIAGQILLKTSGG